jgi:transposase
MESEIVMTKKEARRYDIIKNLIHKKIDGTQASKQLNLSIRQTKRIKAKVHKYGIQGVIHENRGKESNNKIDEKEKVAKIIEEHYKDFTSQLTHEKLQENHAITWNYSTTRRLRIEKGFSIIKKRKKTKHFTQRERKYTYGELIQFDGSYDDWFEGRCTDEGLEEEQCLLLSIDDATGDPTAVIGKNESIQETFAFWKEYIQEQGKPAAIYIDKFSTYKVNHKNASHNEEFQTQFQRAMRELGIQTIFANSPQEKGRVERMNATMQDRLIKEMRLRNICTIQEVNEFIKNEFLPRFKEKFSVKAKKKGDLHTRLTKQEKQKLKNIFCVQTERVVRNDYVIQYKSRYFQLEEVQKVTVYRKDTVRVEEHLDNSIHITKNDTYLNFKELPGKPPKEYNIKLPAISVKKLHYKPPIDHPWRKYQFSKRENVKN